MKNLLELLMRTQTAKPVSSSVVKSRPLSDVFSKKASVEESSEVKEQEAKARGAAYSARLRTSSKAPVAPKTGEEFRKAIQAMGKREVPKS